MASTRGTGRYSRAAVVAVAGVLAATLTACSGGGPAPSDAASASGPVRGGTLVFARTASPTSLDLHSEITANNAFAIDKIFEPLITFDATGALQPWLASAWKTSDDGLTWTFTLRDGVLFSNGQPMSSADVKYSLQRHLDIGGPLPLHAPITAIDTPDDTTVVVTLSAPYTPFAAELAGFSNGIVPKDLAGMDEKDFFAGPIGTGPFTVDTWNPGGDITFAANPHYWQKGKPYLDKLVYKLVEDDNQLIAQLQSGQVQVIDEVPPANVASLSADSALSVSVTDSWEVEELFFNTLDEHFSDAHVRRAAAFALDRDGIVSATGFDTSKPADSLLPPTIEYYDGDIDALSYDVTAAKAELAKSAYPDGFSTTLLIASGNSLRAQEAQIIQSELGAIGIAVEIESVDLAAFRERFRAFDYSFMLNSAVSDVADPNGIVTFQADPDGGSDSYWTHYSDPDVTALIKEGRTTPDGDERASVYADIQQKIADDAPYVPLSYPSNIKAWAADVRGVVVLPNGSTLLQDAWIG